MGHAACDLLEAEVALDRLEASLATELPAHVRGFARAYAAGAATPPAPAAAHRSASLVAARRALAHLVLADRALALVRLLAPIAIEDDPRVSAARSADRTWDGHATLAAARDAAARALFGLGFVELVHRLHGAPDPIIIDAALPEPIDGWHGPCEPIGIAMIEHAWRDLAARHGVRGRCQIISAAARPRAFVVEPSREVIVVVGKLDTPAARFTAIHELGHAVAALVVGVVPRVVDEAAAAYTARLLEVEGALDLAWFTPLATRARERRKRLAAVLDQIEGAISIDRGAALMPGWQAIERPPWALWHDPGAQAAYVAAEDLADRWWAELGPAPAPGAFATALADERARIDAATVLS